MFVKRLDSTIVRALKDGSALAFNVETGEHIVLDEVGGAFISKVLTKAQDVDNICLSLMSMYYGVSLSELRTDFIGFITELGDKGILKISEKPENEHELTDIQIEIITGCNERCVHCYIPNAEKNKCVLMPNKMVHSIIDQFKVLGGKSITLSGGEPLLHPDLCDMINYCALNNLRINIFTNLTLLDDKITSALLDSNIGVVQTSLYSMNPNVHDDITKVPGSFAKTLHGIEKLKENGIEVQIACPVMSKNKEGLSELVDFAVGNGINLRLNSQLMAQNNGDDTFVKGNRLSLIQNKELLCELMTNHAEYVIHHLFELSDLDAALIDNPKKTCESSICSAGKNSCSILVNGNVIPCPSWVECVLGNVFVSSLSDIWNGSALLKHLRHFNKQKFYPECLECKALSFCKRCFAQNASGNSKCFLDIDGRVCDEAFLRKEFFDRYANGNG